jgi:hypothetical protein
MNHKLSANSIDHHLIVTGRPTRKCSLFFAFSGVHCPMYRETATTASELTK